MKKVANPNLDVLEIGVERLEPLLKELVFVGGSATGLLVSDPAASPVRATKDIDAIIQVVSLVEYQRLFKILKKCGFREDNSETAPICRW